MGSSVITQLPKIVGEGQKAAAQILQGMACSSPLLKTKEYIFPPKNLAGVFAPTLVPAADHDWTNRLIEGDNLQIMAALLVGDEQSRLPSCQGKIDLIYIDPPFASNNDYRTKILLPSSSADGTPFTIEQVAYTDAWKNGLAGYLTMLYPRLLLMRELLSDRGSLFVHLDWHAAHYVKLLLDDIFGEENLVNEIIWFYSNGGGRSEKNLARKHDVIFWYAKTKNYTFNWRAVGEPRTRDKGTFGGYFKRDETGREYQEVRANGKIYKYYLDEPKIPDDVWAIQKISQRDKTERVGFDTQKPEALLKRIILLASAENDLVADFFAGSGTTGVAAEKLHRRWILTDSSKPATLLTGKRLLAMGARPFLRQAAENGGPRAGAVVNGKSDNRLLVKAHAVKSAGLKTAELVVELAGYTMAPEDLPAMKKGQREKIKALAENDPLSLIEYWSIDPDYDGETFRSLWQGYRSAKTLKSENRRVAAAVRLTVPQKEGKRTIAVKAIDVFGQESFTVTEI